MDQQVIQTISQFVCERFPLARKRTLGHDEDLLANGIVDSMGVLDIVTFIEAEYKVTATDEDLLPENFGTILRIAAFVDEKKKALL